MKKKLNLVRFLLRKLAIHQAAIRRISELPIDDLVRGYCSDMERERIDTMVVANALNRLGFPEKPFNEIDDARLSEICDYLFSKEFVSDSAEV